MVKDSRRVRQQLSVIDVICLRLADARKDLAAKDRDPGREVEDVSRCIAGRGLIVRMHGAQNLRPAIVIFLYVGHLIIGGAITEPGGRQLMALVGYFHARPSRTVATESARFPRYRSLLQKCPCGVSDLVLEDQPVFHC